MSDSREVLLARHAREIVDLDSRGAPHRAGSVLSDRPRLGGSKALAEPPLSAVAKRFRAEPSRASRSRRSDGTCPRGDEHAAVRQGAGAATDA
ncbi:MAG: hypothetical protein ACXVHX_34005, partial [Solirubrobacteraceae bacterium]